MSDPPTANYTIRFDLYELAELQTKAKVAVEISCGTFSQEGKVLSVEVLYRHQFLHDRMVLPRSTNPLMTLHWPYLKTKIKSLTSFSTL